MKKIVFASALAVAASAFIVSPTARAQAPTWTETDKSDPLHQTSFKEFTLTGKFLVPPRQSNLAAPLLVLHCQPGRRGRHLTDGTFGEGWIATGAVLNSTVVNNTLGVR